MGALAQERSAAAKTKQELAAEQEQATKMAANNQRQQREKIEVESDGSRVAEGLQEHMGKLKAGLVRREHQVTGKLEEIDIKGSCKWSGRRRNF